ncbi:MAG TPA: NAD(P)-binding domain-containing protein [Thermoanaerobaculia bacterium]|nr:NAD(P)-binding domain-containing protein [Thermoanaerobaculia bacterium]
MSKPRIGILGTGDVGRSLGSGFCAEGHEVCMGSRDPGSEKVQQWVAANGPRASAGTFAEAAEHAEVAVLATLWAGTENAIRLAGPERLAGKVVIDAVNPVVFKPNALPELGIGHTDSAGEQAQRWLPAARVVKAFNIVGSAHMVHPQFPDGPPDMFICGNDAEAKRVVTELCTELGWPAIDIGGIEGARLLEPLCLLWVGYAIRTGSGNHAFKLLRR